MTAKSISLPDPLWRLIHRKVESGQYHDESEYLAKLAEADLHRQRLEAWDKFSDEMEEGAKSPLTTPLSERDLDDIVLAAGNAVSEKSDSAKRA